MLEIVILPFEESGCGGVPEAQDTVAGGLLTTLQVNTALSPEETSTAGREAEKAGRPGGGEKTMEALLHVSASATCFEA